MPIRKLWLKFVKIEFMNIDTGLTTVLAISTIAYTIINLLLLRESKATRLQKITPFIIAYLKSSEDHKVLELHIKNIGEGVAIGVKLKTSEDYSRFGLDKLLLSEAGTFKNGFNVFPPQYDLSFQIQGMINLNYEEESGRINIEINYESSDKRQFHNVYALPLNQMIGQMHASPPETFIGQIPYYLNEINKNLETLRKNDVKRTALLQDASDKPEQGTKSPAV